MSAATRRVRPAPRRVLFFAPAPSEPGGAQRRTLLLARGLAARGWHVVVIGRSSGGAWFSLHREGPIVILEVPGFRQRRVGAVVFLPTAVAAGLLCALRTRAFLALQMSSPAIAAGVCGVIFRRPFVVLTSTSGVLSETSLLRPGVRGWLRRCLLRRAGALVAQTPDACEELRLALPGARCSVLANPVHVIESPPPLNGRPLVAYAGRLSEEKDLGRLLTVWERISAELPDARLTLIGAGSAHRSVEGALRGQVLTSPALRRTVRLTGWLTDPTLELTAADIFVFPTLSEGMSNALLEACALGRVPVASDIPANVAVLGDDYPLLFTAGDSEAMFHGLHRALAEAKMRNRCRALVLDRLRMFSPPETAERLEQLLLDASRARN